MNITFSTTYKGLLKQAHSMHLLINSQERELTIVREKLTALTEQRAEIDRLKRLLESEKEMNHCLTQENIALEQAKKKNNNN